MGSLMPGWEAAQPGAPKEFKDYEDEEKRGYFATYSERKSLRKQSEQEGTDAAPELDRPTTLRRSSMPNMRMPSGAGPGLRTASVFVPGRRATADDMGVSGLRTTSTMLPRRGSAEEPMQAAEGPRRFEHSATLPPVPRTVSEGVRRLDPLAEFGGISSEHHVSLDAYKIGKHPEEHDQAGNMWWKKLSSGALNEMAIEEERPTHGKQPSFRPQFDLTGQTLGAFRSHTAEHADEHMAEATHDRPAAEQHTATASLI